MLRIVWGVLVILGGFGLVGNGAAILVIGSFSGNLRPSFLFFVLGVISCLVGSLLVSSGDDARHDRLIRDLRAIVQDGAANKAGRQDF